MVITVIMKKKLCGQQTFITGNKKLILDDFIHETSTISYHLGGYRSAHEVWPDMSAVTIYLSYLPELPPNAISLETFIAQTNNSTIFAIHSKQLNSLFLFK